VSEDRNVEIVRRGYEAFGRWDLETLLALFDEHIEWITPGPSELPTAGRRRGHQGVLDFFKALNALVEIDRFEAKEFIAQGDRVIVLGEDTSLVRSTGRILEFEWAHAFTLKNGRIVAFHEYSDMVAIANEVRAAQARS
jgi:ketosteroid isomerase-like protein